MPDLTIIVISAIVVTTIIFNLELIRMAWLAYRGRKQ